MTTTNTLVAKIAAAVAGFGLVLSAFAPMASAQTNDQAAMEAQIAALMAQIAALQAQTGGSSSASMTFTRDLTIGSTGADVTALQNWLINGGYAIAAGATGYFGAQTQAALASYQAANMITPAAGYFGPITRAKVNASAGGSTGGDTGGDDDDDDDNDDDDNDDLSGGEADLSDFELNDGDDDGAEGEEMVDIATLEFDVEDGDVLVERIEFIASSTNLSLDQRPWNYFDTLYILDADGDEVAEIDASDRDEWDEESDDDTYRIVFTGVDSIVREDDRAEFTLSADIASNIDTADQSQEFEFYVPEDGVRASDSEGIQHYIPATADSEEVTFGFDEEESGDLRIRTNSDDPEAATLISDEDEESEEYTVFIFDIDNDDDVDVEILDLTIMVDVSSTTIALDDVIDDATLMVDGEEFDGDVSGTVGADSIEFEDLDLELAGDDTHTFELVITLVEDAAATDLEFSVDGGDVDAEGVDSGEESEVNGSATSEDHTVAQEGIVATADRDDNENNSDVNDNGVGTFRITFTVDALEEDAYIYRGAAMGDNDATPFSGVASTTGFVYNVISGNSATTTTVNSGTVQSTADLDGQFYVVSEGTSEEFTLTVTVDPALSGSYYVELDAIRFDDINDSSTLNDELYTVPDEVEFESEVESLNT